MGGLLVRGMAVYVLLAFPASMFSADSGAAMLHTHGVAWLNGAHVPDSSAIFSGDLLQTRSDSGADIHAPGSSITILGGSLVEFQGTSLKVEHGGVLVATSKSVATTAGDVRVAPASTAWTEFSVAETEGTVMIAARRGDVTITDDQGTTTLAQGQETTREQPSDSSDKSSGKKKNKKKEAGAAPAAVGGVLNSTAAIAAGAAAITGVTVWAITRNENPVSPSTP